MPSEHSTVTPLIRPRQPTPGTRPSVQGTLALDQAPDLGPPCTPAIAFAPGADVVAIAPPERRDLQRWIVTFSQACVEVVGGDRPVSQLVRWSTPAVHSELSYRAGVVSRAGVHASGLGRGRRPTVRPQVQTVHSCHVDESTVEFCVRVKYGERNRCLAGRLDLIAGRWQCTALVFG